MRAHLKSGHASARATMSDRRAVTQTHRQGYTPRLTPQLGIGCGAKQDTSSSCGKVTARPYAVSNARQRIEHGSYTYSESSKCAQNTRTTRTHRSKEHPGPRRNTTLALRAPSHRPGETTQKLLYINSALDNSMAGQVTIANVVARPCEDEFCRTSVIP